MTAGNRLAGVIGGMGPDATVDFMSRVIAHTPARSDQDHVRMVIEHNPRIPSRQSAMQGKGESPGPVIVEMAARLEARGADFVVMPCNAAHAWQNDVIAAIELPFISIINESVARALQNVSAGGAVGVLTTPACFTAGLYQQALADAKREVVLQTPDELDATMTFIERIKAGDQTEVVAEGLRALADRLVSRGAKTLIAACTELPLVLDESMFTAPLVSSTDVLAERTVSLALSTEPLPRLKGIKNAAV